MRILVVEDEKKTAAFLAKGLREAGFSATHRSLVAYGTRG